MVEATQRSRIASHSVVAVVTAQLLIQRPLLVRQALWCRWSRHQRPICSQRAAETVGRCLALDDPLRPWRERPQKWVKPSMVKLPPDPESVTPVQGGGSPPAVSSQDAA